MSPARYTRTQIAALAGLSPRVVLRWQVKGLLPPTLGRGSHHGGGAYTDEHLTRLLRIKRDLEANVSLADLADRYRPDD